MKVKISSKQYALIEKIARTKVGLNPQWWGGNGNDVSCADGTSEKYDEHVLSNLNGLIREAMVAKYLDSVGVAYDWWIPFASGNIVDRVSEFHISKHRIDVKPIIYLRFIENDDPMDDGKINVDTLMSSLALDATQSYFGNKVDDVYIGVYLNDSLNGDIKGFQWKNSNKWRRYLREYNVPSDPKYAEAMCCPVGDLVSLSSFKDIDDVIFNKSSTSHRFIDVNRSPAIPGTYTWLDNTDEYDMTFIEAWCKEWKLVWDDGVFTRGTHGGKAGESENKDSINIGKVDSVKVRIRKDADKENRRRKLNEEYENVKRKLKEEDCKRKSNDEYENMKKKLRDESVKTSNIEKMEYDMEEAKNVDVLGITSDIVERSKKWKELTDNIVTMSDEKDKKVKRKEELEAELINIGNEIDELSVKIDNFKKESKIIEDSFRLIDQAKKKVEEKN